MTYSDVLLPFGEDESGRLVRVSEVERGAACNCTCPNCGARLIARKGEELQHHFAHSGDGCGSGALETSLHKMAKQIIAERERIWLPPLDVRWPPFGIETPVRAVRGGRVADWFYGDVDLEQRYGNVQPDAVIQSHDMEMVAVEIFVTHAVPAEKRERLKALDFSTIEIDLSRYPRDLSKDKLEEFVLRDAPRFWLHHQKTAEIERDVRRLYLEALDKYQTEERKMRQAQQEAAEAARAELAQRLAREANPLSNRPLYGTPLDLPGMTDALLHVSRIRPSFWHGPEAYPSPGEFCVECQGRKWARFDDGWACVACVPPDIQARTMTT